MSTIGTQLNKLDNQLKAALKDIEKDEGHKELSNDLKKRIAEPWIFSVGRDIFEYRIDNASAQDCDWLRDRIGERLLDIQDFCRERNFATSIKEKEERGEGIKELPKAVVCYVSDLYDISKRLETRQGELPQEHRQVLPQERHREFRQDRIADESKVMTHVPNNSPKISNRVTNYSHRSDYGYVPNYGDRSNYGYNFVESICDLVSSSHGYHDASHGHVSSLNYVFSSGYRHGV